MAFRLCLALGYSHPDELLSRLTLAQYQEWVAFYELEPFGDLRADQRQAAGVLWGISPYLKEHTDLPDLHYPYFDEIESEDDFVARAKRLSAAAKELSGGTKFSSTTSDQCGA